jgi:ATP-dependent Clp protease ATP-binding subunit ClpX
MALPRQIRPPRGAERTEQEIVLYVRSIPFLTPREIAATIRGLGYVGQDRAVTVAALMAHRHVSRLRKIYLEGVSRDLLPAKTNLLLVGPTGCGKTYLVELLFRHVLHLPTVIVDLTGYSETGYVGQDVTSILTRLLYAADLSQAATSVGVVCLDEFDKVASGQNNAVFAGAGTTKDVSGVGVQRELLKMLETVEVAVPNELSHSEYGARTLLSTSDIAFISCGAFSGFKGVTDAGRAEGIGFGRTGDARDLERIAVSYSEDEVGTVRHFQSYGFLPELIGRFKRIVPFQALSAGQLMQILRQNILKQYTNEFLFDEIRLEVDDDVLELMVERALGKETGARGLEAVFMRCLEDAAFEAYSEQGASRIRLLRQGGEVTFKLS